MSICDKNLKILYDHVVQRCATLSENKHIQKIHDTCDPAS